MPFGLRCRSTSSSRPPPDSLIPNFGDFSADTAEKSPRWRIMAEFPAVLAALLAAQWDYRVSNQYRAIAVRTRNDCAPSSHSGRVVAVLLVRHRLAGSRRRCFWAGVRALAEPRPPVRALMGRPRHPRSAGTDRPLWLGTPPVGLPPDPGSGRSATVTAAARWLPRRAASPGGLAGLLRGHLGIPLMRRL